MKKPKLYLPLAASTAGAVLLTLAIYSLRSGNWPGPRMAYALFMGIVTAGLTWVAFRPLGLLLGLRGGWASVAAFYFTVFLLLNLAWILLRQL